MKKSKLNFSDDIFNIPAQSAPEIPRSWLMKALDYGIMRPYGALSGLAVAPFSEDVNLSDIGDTLSGEEDAIYSLRDALNKARAPMVELDIPKAVSSDVETQEKVRKQLRDIPLLGNMDTINTNELSDWVVPFTGAGSAIRKGIGVIESLASKGGRAATLASKPLTTALKAANEIYVGGVSPESKGISVASDIERPLTKKVKDLIDNSLEKEKDIIRNMEDDLSDAVYKKISRAIDENPDIDLGDPETLKQFEGFHNDVLTWFQKKGLIPMDATIQDIFNKLNIEGGQEFLDQVIRNSNLRGIERGRIQKEFNKLNKIIYKNKGLTTEDSTIILEALGRNGKVLENKKGASLFKALPEETKQAFIGQRKLFDDMAHRVLTDYKSETWDNLHTYLSQSDNISDDTYKIIKGNMDALDKKIFDEGHLAVQQGDTLPWSETLINIMKKPSEVNKDSNLFTTLTKGLDARGTEGKQAIKDLRKILYGADYFDYVEGYMPIIHESDFKKVALYGNKEGKIVNPDAAADYVSNRFQHRTTPRKESVSFGDVARIMDADSLTSMYVDDYTRHLYQRPLEKGYRKIVNQMQTPIMTPSEVGVAKEKLVGAIYDMANTSKEEFIDGITSRELFDKILTKQAGNLTNKEVAVFRHFYGSNHEFFEQMAKTLSKSNANFDAIDEVLNGLSRFDISEKGIVKAFDGDSQASALRRILNVFDQEKNVKHMLDKRGKEIKDALNKKYSVATKEARYQAKQSKISIKDRIKEINRQLKITEGTLNDITKTDEGFINQVMKDVNLNKMSPNEKNVIESTLLSDSKYIPKLFTGIIKQIREGKFNLETALKDVKNRSLKGSIRKLENIPEQLKKEISDLKEESALLKALKGKTKDKDIVLEFNKHGRVNKAILKNSIDTVDDISKSGANILEELKAEINNLTKLSTHTDSYNGIIKRLDESINNLQKRFAEGKIKSKQQFRREYVKVSNNLNHLTSSLKTDVEKFRGVSTIDSGLKGTRDLVDLVENYFDNNLPKVGNDALEFFRDWFAHSVGYSRDGLKAQETLRNAMLRITKGDTRGVIESIFPKPVASYLAERINPNLTPNQLTDKIISQIYTNLMGFKTTPILRNLFEPEGKAVPMLQGIPIHKRIQFLNEARYEVLKKPVRDRIRAIGIRSEELTSESVSPLHNIFKRDAGALRTVEDTWEKFNKAGMYLWTASDKFDRYATFRLGEKSVEYALKKGTINKLLTPAYFNEQEVKVLKSLLEKGEHKKLAETFGDYLQRKAHVIYQNASDAPFMTNRINKIMFMFSKYPIDMFRREGRLLKQTFGKGKDMSTRLSAATGLGMDLGVGLAMIAFGRAIGINIDDYHPMSNLSLKYKPPVVAAFTDPSLERYLSMGTPFPSIVKGAERLTGIDKRYVFPGFQKHEGGLLDNMTENKAISDSVLAEALKMFSANKK